jgi:SAM-dependent methyltransferase
MSLCSVRDISMALSEVRRVLKHGGEFLLIEHVAASKGTWLRLWQRLLRPVCVRLDRGCHPDRDLTDVLHSPDLRPVLWERFTLDINTPLVRDWLAARFIKV